MSSLYLEAARVLEKIIKDKAGVKNAVYSANLPAKQKPALLALVSKTVSNLKLLNEALNQVGAFKKEAKMRWAVVLAMATDLLLGAGEIRGGGQVKRFLMEHEKSLRDTVDKKGGIKVYSGKPETGPSLPRYVRVNPSRFKSISAAIELIKSAGVTEILKDEHVPNLLKMDAKFTKTLVSLPCVATGDVILQDKSTCVSAFALLSGRPTSGAPVHVMDVCAAPGGKTLHILEMLRPGDYLTAVEMDEKRAAVLETRLNALGGQRKGIAVQVINCDFLKLQHEDERLSKIPNVTHISLDPSCSGSGMEGPQTKGDRQVRTLASFQKMMLKHAQNEFSPKIICYSTCSVNVAENEEVVNTTVESTKYKVDRKPLPSWWTYEVTDGFVKTSPESAHCRGFFLAKLVRK